MTDTKNSGIMAPGSTTEYSPEAVREARENSKQKANELANKLRAQLPVETKSSPAQGNLSPIEPAQHDLPAFKLDKPPRPADAVMSPNHEG